MLIIEILKRKSKYLFLKQMSGPIFMIQTSRHYQKGNIRSNGLKNIKILCQFFDPKSRKENTILTGVTFWIFGKKFDSMEKKIVFR